MSTNTSMAFCAMDVDVIGSSSSNGGSSSLKRCNSAPMINVQALPCPNLTSTPQHSRPLETSNLGRIRRSSTSSLALNSIPVQSASSPNIKCPTRLHQLKTEETQDREVIHECQTQSAMYISQFCDYLNLDDGMATENNVPHRQRSYSESLHVFTGPSLGGFPTAASSPSPTRLNNRKQCFSPSMHAPLKNSALTPSPSPSPTRKSFVRRSLSPIAILKPSSLSLKRKLDSEADFCSFNMSPAKRFSSGPGTPDRLLVPHPLTHSISCSSLEDSGSPEQLVPAGGTKVNCSHTCAQSSPCYTFRPVSMTDTSTTVMTDSENSDMTEATDISDSSLHHMQYSPATSLSHT